MSWLTQAWHWSEANLLPDAPLLTFGTAVVAGVVAITAIRVQRQIAKKRAVIDFFLKTDLDKEMLAAFDRFNAGIVKLNEATDMTVFERTPEYGHIREYLNIHEIVAVAIAQNVFDEKTCYHYWSGVLVRHCKAAQRVIDHASSSTEGKARYTYDALKRLRVRWEKRLDDWVRKNHPDEYWLAHRRKTQVGH